jgi:hypothetical protein
VLNWNAPLLALPPIASKVTSAQSLVDGASSEFTQNADGVIVKVPAQKKDETDRVIVLSISK